MIPEASQLVNAVQRFCAWAEQESHLLIDARRQLLDLMVLIPSLRHLRYSGSSESDYSRRGNEGWHHDIIRFSDLPFQYYRVVFDPHDFGDSDALVTGNLHDDLADIYGDLWHGLQAYRVGDHDAVFSLWVDSYFFHWGRHARSALAAIDSYYCAHPDSVTNPSEGNSKNHKP